MAIRSGVRRAAGIAALTAAGIVAAVLHGCESHDPSTGNGKTVDVGNAPPEPPRPLLEGWTKPAAALVLSGEQMGFLEPCGCTEIQSGGMGRRHDLFQKLAEQGWPVVALELGGTLARNRHQDRIKFDAVLACLKEMNYSAMALGPEELRLGPDYLISRQNMPPGEDAEQPAFVGANLVFYESDEFGPSRTKLVTAGETTIGVTAVLGMSSARRTFPEGANLGVTITDPQSAVTEALSRLKQDNPDLLVLLSHASVEESRELAGKFPDFDIVLSAGGPEDPDGKPEQIGDTLLLKVGRKGKHVGVVGFYPGDAAERLRFELVDLDNQRFTETRAMKDQLRAYQERLKSEAVEVFLDLPVTAHPTGAEFVGAARCGKCHSKAWNKWKTSRHAHATESLVTGREGEKDPVARLNDPECLACHVTGWQPQEVGRYATGFLTEFLLTEHKDELHDRLAQLGREEHLAPARHDLLQGQQCENCHGPGSEHVRLEESFRQNRAVVDMTELGDARRDMTLTRANARDHLCVQCHDLDNSPGFKFDEYWEKVKHPWRD